MKLAIPEKILDPYQALGLRSSYVPIVEWSEKNFYIKETSQPIKLAPHQKAILNYVFKRDERNRFKYQTFIYSTSKKGGKTTVAGMVARWAAETWGRYREVYCIGNDLDQAKGRAFAAAKVSIELNSEYDRQHQTLPGKWSTLEESLTCIASGSKIKAIAADYAGEAGANPQLSVWTELWGFIHTDALRFWAEMAPSPAVPNSMRMVETYAGFEGESELLYGLYKSGVIEGRQLTAGEIGLDAFEESPNPDDKVPCYVNEAAGIFAYWDSGEQSHRMAWQRGEDGKKYYASEAATQTPNQFTRLHKNEWVSAESSFIPIEWWDTCNNPLPLKPGEKTPLIIGLDAAVSGDCFGLVVVSRDPLNPKEGIAVRACRLWTPPKGGKIDFLGPETAVREFCKLYNVVECTYDPYQLHDLATRLSKDGVTWMNPFDQTKERMEADKQLYDLIVQKRIRHDGNPDLREHITNANSKQSKDTESRFRIVKKSESRHIDLVICLSMSSFESLRLNI
jgi:phage terminase large subunit-like protein